MAEGWCKAFLGLHASELRSKRDPVSNRKRHIPDSVAPHQGIKLYAITRVTAERHGQNAWLVNLSRGGKTFQMTFSDGTYGGQNQALTVATAYRDAVLKVVPPLTYNDMRMRVRRNHSEGSVLPGVYYNKPGEHSKDGAWIARIGTAGRRKWTSLDCET